MHGDGDGVEEYICRLMFLHVDKHVSRFSCAYVCVSVCQRTTFDGILVSFLSCFLPCQGSSISHWPKAHPEAMLARLRAPGSLLSPAFQNWDYKYTYITPDHDVCVWGADVKVFLFCFILFS